MTFNLLPLHEFFSHQLGRVEGGLHYTGFGNGFGSIHFKNASGWRVKFTQVHLPLHEMSLAWSRDYRRTTKVGVFMQLALLRTTGSCSSTQSRSSPWYRFHTQERERRQQVVKDVRYCSMVRQSHRCVSCHYDHRLCVAIASIHVASAGYKCSSGTEP